MNDSADTFYITKKKLLLAAESYTEIKKLSYILKACRLKPFEFALKKRKKIYLSKWWIDEFGNSFKINDDKTISIIYNDLSINRNIVSTDLYYGFSFDKLIKFSKSVCLLYNKEDGNDFYFLMFLGIDNYYRAFIYLDKWQQVSPLILGFKNLRYITNKRDIKLFLEISIKKNANLPCETVKGWISYVPVQEDFLQILRKEFDNTFSFLGDK